MSSLQANKTEKSQWKPCCTQISPGYFVANMKYASLKRKEIRKRGSMHKEICQMKNTNISIKSSLGGQEEGKGSHR